MMDFIDRIIARNLEGELSNSIKPRSRPRFETPDGIVGLDIRETTAQNQEQFIAERPATQVHNIEHPRALKEHQPYSPHTSIDAASSNSEILPLESLPSPKVKTSVENSPGALNEISARHSPATKVSLVQPMIMKSPGVEKGEAALPPVSEESMAERLITIFDRGEEPARAPLLKLDPEPVQQYGENQTVIRVDIGRIEVHTPPSIAQSQPTASRQPMRSVKPVRSLDDYLQRRTERKP